MARRRLITGGKQVPFANKNRGLRTALAPFGMMANVGNFGAVRARLALAKDGPDICQQSQGVKRLEMGPPALGCPLCFVKVSSLNQRG